LDTPSALVALTCCTTLAQPVLQLLVGCQLLLLLLLLVVVLA
jgi:hypothetical protein